jgi:steroid delta-isomerase-like uncharacterized protein
MVMTSCISHEQICDWYRAWNRRDWDQVTDLLAEHFICEDLALRRTIRGKVDYLNYAKAWVKTFSDGAIKVDRILGSSLTGHVVVVEYRFKGTQSGPLTGFEASQREAEFDFVDILRFHNEKLVSCRTYTDFSRPLLELGHLVRAENLPKSKKQAA